MKRSFSYSSLRRGLKPLLLAGFLVGSLTFMLSQSPFGQDAAYHSFADQRTLLYIPHFFNVVSNLPFLLVGIAGLGTVKKDRFGNLRYAWGAFFAGVAMVSFGSAYYHLAPSDESLLWDRLPMTIGFMGLFVALLGEYVSTRLGAVLILPVLLLGMFSVLYWHWFDDLRIYYWVQMAPLITIPAIMLLYPLKQSKTWLLLPALALYLLAKLAEAYDQQIYSLSSGFCGGHSVKHLLAALGCSVIWLMLEYRTPQAAGSTSKSGPPLTTDRRQTEKSVR